MSFRVKIITVVALACVLSTGAAIYISSSIAKKTGVHALIEKSDAILTRLESARNYVADQGLLDTLIANAVVKYPDGKLPKEEKRKILRTVPIFASLKIGADMASKDHYEFRVAARHARNKKNEATDEEVKFLTRFEANPGLKEITHIDEKSNSIWVMRRVRLAEAQGCLNCHGNPSTSPWKNGKDILGREMENWKDGKLHGMFKIVSSMAPIQASMKENNLKLLGWGSGLAVAIILLAFLNLMKPMGLLGRIAEQLKENVVENQKSSDELNKTSHAVSAASTEQSSAIQETVASMTEMNSMIQKTSDLVDQTQKLSLELDAKAREGSDTMEGMVQSMVSIKGANERLGSMVEIINDISVKTNVINEIVFKTQLLSVNASIEAARAGQHGKGFAVVAEEVGNLAQMSGKAAEEIRSMLDTSQKQVNDIVKDTNARVEEGERVSQDALSNFNSVSEGIALIQSHAQHVNEATGQQKEGLNQISEAMNQMDEASRQNNEMAENVSHLGSELISQSETLSAVANEMEHVVYGKTQVGEGTTIPVVVKREEKPGQNVRMKLLNRLDSQGAQTDQSRSSDSDDFTSAA